VGAARATYKTITHDFPKHTDNNILPNNCSSKKYCRRTKTTLGNVIRNRPFNIRKRVLVNYKVRASERFLSACINSLEVNKKSVVSRDLMSELLSKERANSTKPKAIPSIEASVNGKRIGEEQEEVLEVTMETKKQIIQAMLKQGRIPLSMIPNHKSIINSTKTEKEKLIKMADSILETYDMMIQTTSKEIKSNLPVVDSEVVKEKNEEVINPKSLSVSIAKPRKVIKSNINLLIELPEGVKRCPINEIITLINKYCSLAFKSANRYNNLKAINVLHRKLGLGKSILSEDELKIRERVCQLKEGLLRVLYSRLNKENGYMLENTGAPRFYIEKGNNSALVRTLMRERHWWIPSDLSHKTPNLLWTPWKKTSFISALGTADKPLQENVTRISNHFEGNYYLGYKKNMYKCLLLYYSLISRDISKTIPLTFHIKKGETDEEYAKFLKAYNEYKESQDMKNIWIIKPGENTNRGNGIKIASTLTEVSNNIKDTLHTYIIQKYIEKPLLFNNRKFDIRCFALLTSVNGWIKGYYYQDGYLRTSSKDYSTEDFSSLVHLTNEAVQIQYEDFGKRESGNKVSYTEFHKYIHNTSNGSISFYKDILPKIKVIFSFIVEYYCGYNKIGVCFYR